MAINEFTKQAYEEFVIAGDFSNNLVGSEVVDSQSAAAVDKDRNDVSSTILDLNTLANDGTSKVSILVKGGTYDASPYKITLKCVTNAVIPHKWEIDIMMRVKEI